MTTSNDPELTELANYVSAGCPNCEHDGCFPVRYCDGCDKDLCMGCWGEHNLDEPPNDHTTSQRVELNRSL